MEDKFKPLSPKTILEHHRLISMILAQPEKEMIVKYIAAAKATPPRALLLASQPIEVLQKRKAEPLRTKICHAGI